MDKNIARFLLMKYVDLFALLHRLGKNPRDSGNMFCPFHHNTNTPSAKLYKDEYGWVLWCFNEKRIFTTYDAYERLTRTDPMQAAKVLWDKLNDKQKQEIINTVGTQKDFEGDVPYMEDLDLFSQGKISYERLCDLIALKL